MKENVLLISNVFPAKNYSGGILSKQLANFLIEEKHNLVCVKVSNMDTKEVFDEEMIQKIKTYEVLFDTVTNKNERVIFKQLKKIIKKEEIMIKMAYKIIKELEVPCYVQIWDPIEWTLNRDEFNDEKREEILSIFEYVVKNAKFCFTASLAMQEIYKERYNVETLPLFTSIKDNDYPLVINDKNEFTIVFSGQTYAESAFKALFDALDKLNWNYKRKKIVFKYFGSNNFSFLKKKQIEKISFMGYVSQEELMDECNKADLLYCPYFFSNNKALRKVATESFPSKIVTYLPAKTALLIHAPKYSSVYKFFENKDASYLLDSQNVLKVTDKLKEIISNQYNSELIKKYISNSLDLFNKHFLPDRVKELFLKGMGITYDNKHKIKILEVNNVDLSGRRFNGYDIQEYINQHTIHNANQIVTYKTSDSNNVYKFHDNYRLEMEYLLMNFQYEFLSVHSNLSLTTPVLTHSDLYNNADIVHFHLFHNTRLSLYSLLKFYNDKKIILSIHDPWNFTGRCVHFEDCNKWKTGCVNCPYLDSLFPLKEDNCSYLWNLKKNIYKNMNPHILVSSEFMYNLVKESPLTKHFTNVHLLPFGIDLDLFNDKIDKEKSRKKFKISKDDIVLFFRSQEDFKGTSYIIEALNKLETDRKITILTCSQEGNLKNLYNKYNVIELGNIDTPELLTAYSACDMFLMPSIGESFGLMAVEAMACGRPVVVFNNTALPSVTNAPKVGILVKNKDSNDLMKKIKWLIENDEERIKRGMLSRKWTLEKYDVNKYNQEVAKLYEQIYNEKKDHCSYANQKEDNNQANLIKNKLNKCSEIMFTNAYYRQKLLFKVPKKIDYKQKIDYSNISVQKVIDEYNNNLYNIVNLYRPVALGLEPAPVVESPKTEASPKVKEIIESKPVEKPEDKPIAPKKVKVKKPKVIRKKHRKIKTIRWIINFIRLYRNDRERLKEIMRYEFRNHPKILDKMKSFYKRIERKSYEKDS